MNPIMNLLVDIAIVLAIAAGIAVAAYQVGLRSTRSTRSYAQGFVDGLKHRRSM